MAFRATVFPLAGVASRPTVQPCEERGYHPVYQSDEHGFLNPPGLWSAVPADLVLIGDSFVHGYCVEPGQTIAALLRRRWPRVFNLGSGGSGPLSELATLTGDEGARRLIARYPAHGLEVDDPGVLVDVDTLADLASVRQASLDAAAAAR